MVKETRILDELGKKSILATFPTERPLTVTLVPTCKPSTFSYFANRIFSFLNKEVPLRKLNPNKKRNTPKKMISTALISFDNLNSLIWYKIKYYFFV